MHPLHTIQHTELFAAFNLIALGFPLDTTSVLPQHLRQARQFSRDLELILGDYLFQRTTQCFRDPNRRSEQHINFSCLDSLNVADVQIGRFCELLLCNAFGRPLASDIVAELFEPRRRRLRFWHRSTFRADEFDGNGVCAVFWFLE